MKIFSFTRLASFIVLAILILSPHIQSLSASPAMQGEEEGPVYIVQPGDTLWAIAIRFGVSVTDLMNANRMSDAGQLAAGARLVIPGLKGIQGVLTTSTIAYGDTLRSLSRRYQLPIETLVRLNHVTSPAELYAGATLVIPEPANALAPTRRSMLSPGQSLLELAIAQNANPWSYVNANNLAGAWSALPGEVLHLPAQVTTTTAGAAPSALPESIATIQLKPGPLVQGKAAVMRIQGAPGLAFSGRLHDYPLHFFTDQDGAHIALQGIHALTDPGLYTLALTTTLPQDSASPGAVFTYSQAVLIKGGDYPYDPVLIVSPETIDPAVTLPEEAQWAALSAPITPQRLWQGVFQSPVAAEFKDCWPSYYGNRRSYNGSAYTYFHTGLDYCGTVGNDIYALGAGVIVFAGPLTVRGNATMINHGWGVYSGYMHQSEFLVKVGDHVEAGQLIGKVGGSGRATGAHLHVEIWVGGVQVDPMDWLTLVYP